MRSVSNTLTNVGVRANTPSGVVQQFIHEVSDYVYVTETFPNHKGEVGQFIQLPDRKPVKVHISQNEGMVRLDKKAFREWLKQNGHQQATIITALTKECKMHELRTCLAPKLSGGSSPRTYIFELPLED